MKQIIASIALLLVLCCLLTGCIPPLIDGAVEPAKYFDDKVECKAFQINPSFEGGFESILAPTLSLKQMTDGDEVNIQYAYYLSFTFTTLRNIDESKLNGIIFTIQSERETTIELILTTENGEYEYSKRINTNVNKQTVDFSGLNLIISADMKLTITLANPLVANAQYRIDTLVFLIGEKDV